jgi:hypothetical protein
MDIASKIVTKDTKMNKEIKKGIVIGDRIIAKAAARGTVIQGRNFRANSPRIIQE